MNDIREHRIVCLNNHAELTTLASSIRNTIDSRVGNEDFVDNLKDLGTGLLSVTQWVGGKSFNLFSVGIKKLGVQLHKVFDDNKMLSSKINGALKEEHYNFTLSTALVGSVTSTGQWSDFDGDLEELIKTAELLTGHMGKVNDYLSHQLVTIRKYKSASNTSAVMAIVKEFEGITYPPLTLPNKNNGWTLSHVLPAGRVIKFKDTDGNIEYSMSGDKPAGESHTLSVSKSEVQHILNQINKLNGVHQKVKESYATYLDFIKAWSDVVKEADTGLSKIQNVGNQIIHEAENTLKGDAIALTFYSGFTPRVVNYVDKYIQDVLGIFSKVI